VTRATYPVVVASGGVAAGQALILHPAAQPDNNGHDPSTIDSLTVDTALDRVAEELNRIARAGRRPTLLELDANA
jgi:hypothetical protein